MSEEKKSDMSKEPYDASDRLTNKERKEWVDELVENQTPRQLAWLYVRAWKKVIDVMEDKIGLIRRFYHSETAFAQERYDMELLLQKHRWRDDKKVGTLHLSDECLTDNQQNYVNRIVRQKMEAENINWRMTSVEIRIHYVKKESNNDNRTTN